MNLTRDNYEQYFLDYYEGSLDESQVRVLMVFLDEHPDLKQEFEEFSMITLDPAPAISFSGKDSLKKEEISGQNADRFFAAWVEGDLTAMQQAEAEAFLASHPEKARDLDLMKKAVLTPDMDIRFPRKSALKHHTITPLMRKLWYATSVAATVLIMAGLFFNWNPEIPTRGVEIPLPRTTIDTAATDPALPADEATDEPAERVETPVRKAPAATPSPAETPAASPSAGGTSRRPMPEPLNAGRLQGKDTPSLPTRQTLASSQTMEQKTEFSYWSAAVAQQQRAASDEPRRNGRSSSLTSLALSRLERTLPGNVTHIQEKIASGNRISLWDVAGMGLAGLSNLTGTPLNMQQQRDEEGKITGIALGESIGYRKD